MLRYAIMNAIVPSIALVKSNWETEAKLFLSYAKKYLLKGAKRIIIRNTK